MSNYLYHLAFSHFLGIGPAKFFLLKKHFSSAEKAYLADKNKLKEIIGEKLTEKFIEFRNKFDPVKKAEELKKKEIEFLVVDSNKYPKSLKNISDPPICLYLRGRKEIFLKDKIFFAIVGTRKPTEYGIKLAKKFSYELAKAGFIIVSGMAYGIDTIAHWSCLEAGGETVAVLGCGVDIIYPAANRDLYNKIIQKNGAIVSEFPPGQMVLKGLFISRNRVISGLSKGVMVVEGGEDSGSLITARYAAEQGKDVFAPPSPITSKMSAAPNILLKQGAKFITSIEDVFEEFQIKIHPKKKEDILKNLTEEEKKVYLLLEKKKANLDDLAIILKKPVSEVLKTISLMEIKGLVEKNTENYYEIRLL